jgi:hypothetical protein
MADLNVPVLSEELMRSVVLARKAYDEGMTAYRSATNADEKVRIQQVLRAISDVVNAVQGCAYTVGHAARQQDEPCPDWADPFQWGVSQAARRSSANGVTEVRHQTFSPADADAS